jgi:hypothetical protein
MFRPTRRFHGPDLASVVFWLCCSRADLIPSCYFPNEIALGNGIELKSRAITCWPCRFATITIRMRDCIANKQSGSQEYTWTWPTTGQHRCATNRSLTEVPSIIILPKRDSEVEAAQFILIMLLTSIADSRGGVTVAHSGTRVHAYWFGSEYT